MTRTALFHLYRLNLVDNELPLVEFAGGKNMRTDEDIINVMFECKRNRYDQEKESKKAHYKWSIREVRIVKVGNDENDKAIVATMARSTLQREGEIVTDDGIVDGQSESYPPLADTFGIIIFLKRHLVAIEYNSTLLNSHYWREAFHKINTKAATALGFTSFISIEAVSPTEEMTDLFHSFDKVTRLKVAVRIPNPELDKWTQCLYDEMVENGIREYLQDMKSKTGLNQQKGMRPHTSLRMAEVGYKDGDVLISGIRKDKHETLSTGHEALSVASKIPKVVLHEALLRPYEPQLNIVFKRISELIDENYEAEE